MTSGPLSIPLATLKTMLSKSATFQAWVNAATEAEALASIHVVSVESEDERRPFAIINIGAKWASNLSAGGAGNFFINDGELILAFEADVAEVSESLAVYEFLDKIGAIIEEIQALSGLGGYLSFHSIECSEPPVRSVDNELPTEGDYYRTAFAITYGV
jgi:hypothetical protein